MSTTHAIMPYADYKSICDAVREKNGSTSLYKSGELASAISAIETASPLPFDELYNDDASITFTSTTEASALTITGITGICTYPFLLVVIKNNDLTQEPSKFIQSASIISNRRYQEGLVGYARGSVLQYYNSEGTYTGSANNYGLRAYSIGTKNGGTLTIYGDCSTYFTSLTGAYNIKVYGVRM